MDDRKRTRALLVSVGVSLALHLLLGWSLGLNWSALALLPAPPSPPPTPPEPIRFELVETPESAADDEEPDDPTRISDRTTRSQDQETSEAPANDRPRITEDGRSHDLRPQAVTVQAGAAPTAPTRPSAPASRSAPTRRRERQPEISLASPQEQRSPRPDSVERPSEPGESQAAAPALPPGSDPSYGRLTLSPAERDELAKAEARGEFSYAATQHFFAEYFLRVKRKIEAVWNLLLVTRIQPLEPSEVVLQFKILPDGSVREMRLLDKRGDESFPLLCIRSVDSAGPFGPIPYGDLKRFSPGVEDLPLNVRVSFSYE